MDELEVRRARLKEAQRLRAEFNYKVALARIDFKLDVEEPAVEAIGKKVEQGALVEFTEEGDDVRASEG